jgi:hypothetical protein
LLTLRLDMIFSALSLPFSRWLSPAFIIILPHYAAIDVALNMIFISHISPLLIAITPLKIFSLRHWLRLTASPFHTLLLVWLLSHWCFRLAITLTLESLASWQLLSLYWYDIIGWLADDITPLLCYY